MVPFSALITFLLTIAVVQGDDPKPTWRPTPIPFTLPPIKVTPTSHPTEGPPTYAPTEYPSPAPTTHAPTGAPTPPTPRPTGAPTTAPTEGPPTMAPTESPTAAPITAAPTEWRPTDAPTDPPIPTAQPLAPSMNWTLIACTPAGAATPSIDQFQALMKFTDAFHASGWLQTDERGNEVKIGKTWTAKRLEDLCHCFTGIQCAKNENNVELWEVVGITLPNSNVQGNLEDFNWTSLDTLKYINLVQNNISGDIQSIIKSCPNLVNFNLNSNRVTGNIDGLETLTKLKIIDFTNNELTGTIPATLLSLPELELLALDSNKLTGELIVIPPNVTDKKLTQINIQLNLLTGPFPDALFEFENLKIITLNANVSEEVQAQLTGTISDKIGNLKDLVNLNLGNNALTGFLPSNISNLQKLQSCSIQGNQLSGTIPDMFYELERLDTLNLGMNLFEGLIPPSIFTLSKLKILNLGGNSFTGPLSTKIGLLTYLESLDLKGVVPDADDDSLGLNGTIPEEIFNLTRLVFLYLSFNSFEGTISTRIAQLESLETISLENNVLCGSIPDEFFTLKNISNVWLNKNKLTGVISPEIGNFDKLKVINLHTNLFSGKIPLFFNISAAQHHFTVDQENPDDPLNWLSDNKFLCPLEAVMETNYSAECTVPVIQSVYPVVMYTGMDQQINLYGTDFPITLSFLKCRIDGLTYNVSLSAETMIICIIPKNKFYGTKNMTIVMVNDEDNILAWTEITFFDIPFQVRLPFSNNSEREQGGGTRRITVEADYLEGQATFFCRFDNITQLGEWWRNEDGELFGTCLIPPHPPGLVTLRVGNDDVHWSDPIPFVYYAYCPGFPLCSSHGYCVNASSTNLVNVTTGNFTRVVATPYCECRSPGFNQSLDDCSACSAGYFGDLCAPCVNCSEGAIGCDDGFAGTGACKCAVLWMGTECEIFWLTYFSPAYLLVVIVLSVLVIIKLGRNKCTRFIRRVREHRLFRPRFKPGAKPDAGPNANNDANGSASGEKGVLSDGSASNGGSGSSSKSTGASNGAKSPPIANGAGKNKPMEDDLPKVIIGDGGSSDDELDMSLEESYDPWKKKTLNPDEDSTTSSTTSSYAPSSLTRRSRDRTTPRDNQRRKNGRNTQVTNDLTSASESDSAAFSSDAFDARYTQNEI